MAFGVKMRIGDEQISRLARRLADLDQKVATKAIKTGVNEITKDVLWDARALVPVRSKQLRKSLGRLVRVYRNSKVVVGIIGPRRGFKVQYRGKWVNPVNYAHLVEYGRREVRVKKKKVLSEGSAGPGELPGIGTVFGKRVRAVPPRPFLRPAWERNRLKATRTLLAHLRAGFRQYLAGGRSRGSRKAA